MRKILALLLSATLILTSCGTSSVEVENSDTVEIKMEEESNEKERLDGRHTDSAPNAQNLGEIQEEDTVTMENTETRSGQIGNNNFDISVTGLDDENLLRYVEDNVYSGLVTGLNSDNYFVENVEAVYYPKEYIDELSFNSQKNIYFGYTIEELDAQFQGSRYVFTLDNNGQTTVVPMDELKDDSCEKVIRDVAIGTGIILVSVTVATVSAGVGAPAISMIFAASAKTGTVFALSSGGISGVAAAITVGYQTEDFDKAMEAGILAATDGFKWGAIMGAVSGGASKTIALKGATKNGLSLNEVARIQKESGYPLDLLKQFKSMEEYNIYKEAGLYTKMVDGRLALVRDIDLSFISELPDGREVSNLTRMQMGYAPIDPVTGKSYELHHINQEIDGTLAILKNGSEHQGNAKILNTPGKEGVHAKLSDGEWAEMRERFWKKYAATLLKG